MTDSVYRKIYVYSEYHARPDCFRTMIDWVSIVRHSRRRFSDYIFTVPTKIRKRRRVKRHTNSTLSSPNDRDTISRSKNDRSICECYWTHVSSNASKRNVLITRLEIAFASRLLLLTNQKGTVDQQLLID